MWNGGMKSVHDTLLPAASLLTYECACSAANPKKVTEAPLFEGAKI